VTAIDEIDQRGRGCPPAAAFSKNKNWIRPESDVVGPLVQAMGMLDATQRIARPRGKLVQDIQRGLPRTKIECVFDVGANVGQTVALIRSGFPHCPIYAFEPVVASYLKLLEATASDELTRCFNLALSSKPGESAITAKDTVTNNRLVRKHVPGTQKVQLETGDRFCNEHSIDRISFLKIDTEGHDLNVLRGFRAMLFRETIDILEVECGMNPTNRLHVPLTDMISFLASFNYHMFYVYEQVPERRGPRYLRRANVVFISSATADLNKAK
jgi:FkbM family methyltransferase